MNPGRRTYVLLVRQLAGPEVEVGMQYGTSGPGDGIPYRERKLGYRGFVELGDEVLDHLGVQGCPRERVDTAHFEKRPDVRAVGQAEGEQVRDDEGLDVHQEHDPAGVVAVQHRLLMLVNDGSASCSRPVGNLGFRGGDACHKQARGASAAAGSTTHVYV